MCEVQGSRRVVAVPIPSAIVSLSPREEFSNARGSKLLSRPFVRPVSSLGIDKLGRKFAIFLAKLVLPVPPSIAEPLLEGANSKVIVKDNRITRVIPQDLMTCRDAIKRAIQKDSLQIVETNWTDAGEIKPPEWVHTGDAAYAGGTLLQGGFRASLDEWE